MVKRLLLLNGLAIAAVVLHHSVSAGYLAMFHWANYYSSVKVPFWDPIGTIEYYILLILKILPVFSVPAFIFVAGFFIAYAARGSEGNVGWSTIRSKIIHLIYPYLIWSFFIFVLDLYQGNIYTPVQYLEKIFIKGALAHYGFIPLLIYLYLLSPFLIKLARINWRLFLLGSTILQLGGVLVHFLRYRVEIDNPVMNVLELLTAPWLPTMWILYLSLGILFGLYMQPFKQWLKRWKTGLFIAWGFALVWMMIDADVRFQANPVESPIVYYGLITFIVYSILSIFCFLLIDKIPFSNILTYLGSRTFGIYLIHWTVLSVTAQLLIRFLPAILAYRILIVPLFFALGLGVPLAMMKITSLTPLRKYQRHIFG